MRQSEIRSLMRSAGPFRVRSRANGLLTIMPRWPYSAPKGCKPGNCRRCGCRHMGGVFTRRALAFTIERLLNGLLGDGAGRRA